MVTTTSSFRTGLVLAAALLTALPLLHAGWGDHAHVNYLDEAIRIVPYWDYAMCRAYHGELVQGMVEGEMQFKFRAEGRYPAWLGTLDARQVSYLNGIPIEQEDVPAAAGFFATRIGGLREELLSMRRPYAEIMFELGYLLHALDNVLIPLYEHGHFPEQQLASNTQAIELRTEAVDRITELGPWLEKRLALKLEQRREWSRLAAEGDLEGFTAFAAKANAINIYTLASVLSYVVDGCYGPASPEARAELAALHGKHLGVTGGRKPLP